MRIDEIAEKYGVNQWEFVTFLTREADKRGIRRKGFLGDSVVDEDVERAIQEYNEYFENTEEGKLKKKREEERLLQEQLENERAKKAVEEAGGYWEYKVVDLVDDESGSIIPTKIEHIINELGSHGWHLRCAYTNEIGHNSRSSGAYGVSSGTNATIDQSIFIFERFIKNI